MFGGRGRLGAGRGRVQEEPHVLRPVGYVPWATARALRGVCHAEAGLRPPRQVRDGARPRPGHAQRGVLFELLRVQYGFVVGRVPPHEAVVPAGQAGPAPVFPAPPSTGNRPLQVYQAPCDYCIVVEETRAVRLSFRSIVS